MVYAECMPAFGRREQIAECFAGAALRDPESPPGLQEEKGVDPPGGWVTVSRGGGDGIGLVEAAEGRERVDAERGGPGDGQRRGGRELEIQRQLAVVGGIVELPEPPHDHRSQAAGMSDHAHGASPAGGGQDRIADAAGGGQFLVPDQDEQGVDRGEGVGRDIAQAGGKHGRQAGQGVAGRLGGGGGAQGVVNVPCAGCSRIGQAALRPRPRLPGVRGVDPGVREKLCLQAVRYRAEAVAPAVSASRQMTATLSW